MEGMRCKHEEWIQVTTLPWPLVLIEKIEQKKEGKMQQKQQAKNLTGHLP